MNAKIITIEGTDCSGKETQSKLLIKKLEKLGKKVKVYSFPTYETGTGRIVGECYLGKGCKSFFEEGAPNVDPLISSLYFAANRRDTFLKEIEKELDKNDYIILDRYTTSNMGHQGGKGKTKKEKDKILEFLETLEFELLELPRPDMVIFLHMPYEAACFLKQNREELDDNEKSEKHLREAEANYLYICKKYNWEYIECVKNTKITSKDDIRSIEEINEEIFNKVLKAKVKEKTKMTRY